MPRFRKWLTMREVITFSRAKWATRPAATVFSDKQSFMIPARRVGGQPKDDGNGGMCESLSRATIKIDVIIIIFFRDDVGLFGFSGLLSLFALLVYTYYCTLVCGLIGLRKDQPAMMSVPRHSYGDPTVVMATRPRRDAHSQNSRFSSTRVKSH